MSKTPSELIAESRDRISELFGFGGPTTRDFVSYFQSDLTSRCFVMDISHFDRTFASIDAASGVHKVYLIMDARKSPVKYRFEHDIKRKVGTEQVISEEHDDFEKLKERVTTYLQSIGHSSGCEADTIASAVTG